MRLAVTGATGLVGRTVVNHLIERNVEVIVVGRDTGKLKQYFTDPVTIVQSNYELPQLTEVFQGCQAVVHLAARRTAPSVEGFKPFYESNIQVTETVMEAAGLAGVTTVCQASSLSVYSSSNSVPCIENDAPIPVSLYGISKLACEHIGVLAQRKYPMRVISLRISAVLGYGDSAGEGFMLARFIQLARKKETLHIFGEGVGARDMIYVKDVARAFDHALRSESAAGVFNIGANRPYSVRELAETINQTFDNVGNIIFDTTKPEDKRFLYMDCSRAQNDLQWKPEWTLAMGLAEMRKEYEAQ